MVYDSFQEFHFSTANELWDYLSPTNEPFKAPYDLIYRGHGDSEWELIPKILRNGSESVVAKVWWSTPKAEDQVFVELRILNSFARFCDQIGIQIPNDSMEFRKYSLSTEHQDKYLRQPDLWPNPRLFEIMALAQHHGVHTRLLDWTRNPYVAAYFAASSALTSGLIRNENGTFSVWVLNIESRNLYPKLSVVPVPGSVSPHLAAQFGLFTAHPHDGRRGGSFQVTGLEKEFATLPNTPLTKLTAPVRESPRLLELCQRLGYTAATMYPSADGAGRAVMENTNLWAAKRRWRISR